MFLIVFDDVHASALNFEKFAKFT